MQFVWVLSLLLFGFVLSVDTQIPTPISYNGYNCTSDFTCVEVPPPFMYSLSNYCEQLCTSGEYYSCSTAIEYGNGWAVYYNTGNCTLSHTWGPYSDLNTCQAACSAPTLFYCDVNLGCQTTSRVRPYPGQISYNNTPPANIGIQQCGSACQSYHYCSPTGICMDVGFFDNSINPPLYSSFGIPIPPNMTFAPGKCSDGNKCVPACGFWANSSCCASYNLGDPCSYLGCCSTGQQCINNTCATINGPCAYPPTQDCCQQNNLGSPCGETCCPTGQLCCGNSVCYVNSACIEMNANCLSHTICSRPIAIVWIVLFAIGCSLLFLITIIVTRKYYVSKIVRDETQPILNVN